MTSGNLFTVRSSRLHSGTRLLSITQLNEQGAASEPRSAGSATILNPPTVTQSTLQGANVVEISGSGAPGAEIQAYSNVTLVGSVTAGSDGSFTFTTTGLGIGNHNITVTQKDSAGESDPEILDPVNVSVPKPSVPIIASTQLVLVNKALVTGTATPGATVNIFEAGVSLGSTTASNSGSWQFTSSGLAPGKHSFEASQTVGGATSDRVDAGSVTVVTVASSTLAPVVKSTTPPAALSSTTTEATQSVTKTKTLQTSAGVAGTTSVAPTITALGTTKDVTLTTSGTTSETITSSVTETKTTSSLTTTVVPNWPIGLFGYEEVTNYGYGDAVVTDSTTGVYFSWGWMWNNQTKIIMWDGYNISKGGPGKGVVIKVSQTGGFVQWVTQIGGAPENDVTVWSLPGLVVSPDEQYVYAGGRIRASGSGKTNFTVGTGTNFTFELEKSGSGDNSAHYGLIVKIRASDGVIVWADVINKNSSMGVTYVGRLFEEFEGCLLRTHNL